MKKLSKILTTVVIVLSLIVSVFGNSVVYAKSSAKTIRRTMHSGYGKKKRTLQRARVDSRKDLNKGLSIITDYLNITGKERADIIDGTPVNRDELYSYLRGLYYNEDCFLILGGNEFNKFAYQEDWGYDGQFINWQPLEPLMPGIISISNDVYNSLNDDGVLICETPFTVIMIEYDTDDVAVIERCREIAKAIKNEYGDKGVLECAIQLKNYLLSISKYNKRNYDMYELLFEGKCNCQAYTDTFDTVMKFMNIPCATVESVDYNHAWNIFYADDKIYKIDVTNNWGPVLLEEKSKIYDMDYPEVETKILDIERDIINAKPIELKKVEFEINDIAEDPLAGLPTMIPIQTAIAASGSAITVTPTATPTPALTGPAVDNSQPTPTPTQEPTPTLEPLPTDTVNLGESNKPGQVTIADEDEANTIFVHEKTPTDIDITRIDITYNEITVYCSSAEYGGIYSVCYRREDQDWVYSTNYTGIHRLLGLKSGTTYYIKTRNVIYNYKGEVVYGNWSRVYKVTTDKK